MGEGGRARKTMGETKLRRGRGRGGKNWKGRAEPGKAEGG